MDECDVNVTPPPRPARLSDKQLHSVHPVSSGPCVLLQTLGTFRSLVLDVIFSVFTAVKKEDV